MDEGNRDDTDPEKNDKNDDRPVHPPLPPGWWQPSTKVRIEMVNFFTNKVGVDYKNSSIPVMNFKVHNKESLITYQNENWD